LGPAEAIRFILKLPKAGLAQYAGRTDPDWEEPKKVEETEQKPEILTWYDLQNLNKREKSTIFSA